MMGRIPMQSTAGVAVGEGGSPVCRRYLDAVTEAGRQETTTNVAPSTSRGAPSVARLPHGVPLPKAMQGLAQYSGQAWKQQ